MNTIGKVKLEMALDDIIAIEPERYAAATPKRNEMVTQTNMKMYRPKLYGLQSRKRPYVAQNRPHLLKRLNYGFPAKQKKPSPYDHNSFKINGVHICESSALLTRQAGEVEITPRSDYYGDEDEDEVIVEEVFDEEDEEEEDETEYRVGAPVIGVPVPVERFPADANGVAVRRYEDIQYVRRPVHQRLGWNPKDNNKFRRSRVEQAAKILRQKQKKRGAELHRLGAGQHRQIGQNNKKLPKFTRRQGGLKEENFKVLFVNELATGKQPRPMLEMQVQQPMVNGNNGHVFLAPLSQQNVAMLPGGNFRAGTSSHLSTATVEEKLADLVNTLADQKVNHILGSMAGGSSSAMSMVGYKPYNPTGSVTFALPGGGTQTFIPAELSTASMANGFQQQQQPSQRIVEFDSSRQLVVQTQMNENSAAMGSPRIKQQLKLAAMKQPLTDDIQAFIVATKLEHGFNNHERAPQESFSYRPTPKLTGFSTNDRFKRYPKPKASRVRGRHSQ